MATASLPLTQRRPPNQPLAYSAGDAAIIAASGCVDSASYSALDRRMVEALDEGRRHLVLDLHDVESIEPDALGFLWATLRGVRRRGAKLSVAGAPPSLDSPLGVLSSGGLATYRSVGAALASAHMPLGSA